MKQIKVLILIWFIQACSTTTENKNVASDDDSIMRIDTVGFQSPEPPYDTHDTVIRRKFHKKDLVKEYLEDSKTSADTESKFWYLNEVIKLDSTNAEAYFERGILKNALQSTFPPTDGCPDICKAYELGFPRFKSDNCNCKE
jgi:hypothetical protein